MPPFSSVCSRASVRGFFFLFFFCKLITVARSYYSNGGFERTNIFNRASTSIHVNSYYYTVFFFRHKPSFLYLNAFVLTNIIYYMCVCVCDHFVFRAQYENGMYTGTRVCTVDFHYISCSRDRQRFIRE